MTPAEKAGLKVGDKIVAIEGYPDYFKKGEIIELKKDDGSNSPLFLKEDRSESWYFDIVERAWEKYNMNKEFKAMKFWFEKGEEELRQRVIRILEQNGYHKGVNLKPNTALTSPTTSRGVTTYESGEISAACSDKDHYWLETLRNVEEINIDWMRTAPKRSLVKIGDKSYYEDELAEALSGINEVGEV